MDAYRVELQGDLIKVKLVKLQVQDSSFSPECLPIESAVKLEDSRIEPERIEEIDEIDELQDDDVEENEEDDEEEEIENNSATCSAGKKKVPSLIFSVKQRHWFIENFTYSPDPNSFITKEEIASEYSKAHPETRPLATALIGKIVKLIWGNKVRPTRRRLHNTTPDNNRRITGYSNLIVKTFHPVQAAKLSESVFCLPVSELAIPGWTVEMFLCPFGIRYRKSIQQFYVNKHAAMLEVYFSMYEEHAEERNNSAVDGNNGTDPSGIDSATNNSNSTCINENSSTSNTDPVRKLCANILCSGRVVSAEELDIWDNKSVPTLGKVKNLLEVVSSSRICFGCDINESWKYPGSIDSECLNPKEKVLTVYQSFDEILSNNGQQKLFSTDCKILVSSLQQHTCENCSHVLGMVRRRKSRDQKYKNKNSMYINDCKMTRAELQEKLKRKNAEILKCKSRGKYLRKKLTGVNGTDSEQYTVSESSDDEEEAESES